MAFWQSCWGFERTSVPAGWTLCTNQCTFYRQCVAGTVLSPQNSHLFYCPILFSGGEGGGLQGRKLCCGKLRVTVVPRSYSHLFNCKIYSQKLLNIFYNSVRMKFSIETIHTFFFVITVIWNDVGLSSDHYFSKLTFFTSINF